MGEQALLCLWCGFAMVLGLRGLAYSIRTENQPNQLEPLPLTTFM